MVASPASGETLGAHHLSPQERFCVLLCSTPEGIGAAGIRDLMTPVPADAPLEIVRESDEEGLDVIRHSTAHVMADAVQRLFPGTK